MTLTDRRCTGIVTGMFRRTLLVTLTITSLGALQASSAMALRYASPSGTSAQSCQTAATACDLTTAIHGLGMNTPVAGEEIVVEPGTYPVTATIQPGATGLNVHGVDGQPRPKLLATTPVQIINGVNINLSYLEFTNTGPGLLLNVSNGALDRLYMHGDAGGQLLCQCYYGTLRNSLVVVTGGIGAVGVNSNGGQATEDFRNDTFISTSASTAAIETAQQSSTQGSANAVIALTGENVIARNLAGGYSVSASQQLSTQTTTVTLSHSDLGTTHATGGAAVIATGADITDAPVFADAANGDFHPLVASPTIDAGVDDALNGPLDFDGAPRTVATTDMGAFEYAPPVVVDPPVVDPPVVDPPATGDPATPAVPVVVPPSTVPVVAPVAPLAPPRLTLSGHAFAFAATTAKTTVSALCTAPSGTVCTVTGTLRAPHGLRGAKRAKALTVGTLRGTLQAGKRGTLTLSLTHAALVVLRPPAHGKARRLAVSLSVTVRSSGGAKTSAAAVTVSVRAAKGKAKKR
ncbi:MAG TPA: choice-of-anchor Q domain-containing protein [Baekduia sp.]|jgi:hypothetical protein